MNNDLKHTIGTYFKRLVASLSSPISYACTYPVVSVRILDSVSKFANTVAIVA